MPDTFAITIVFIVVSTMIAAFIRRKSRDKCLRDFEDYVVTLEKDDSGVIAGKLMVENTGLEFIYPDGLCLKNGYPHSSYIFYKQQYPLITAIIRFLDELTEQGSKKREMELEKTYHPPFLPRTKRRLVNVFKTIRDSVMEVINMMISQAKKTGTAGAMLTSQDKQVSKIKTELAGSVGASYEPLMERYIGNKVIVEMTKGDQIFHYCGVLKEYTANFVEIMDVDYCLKKDSPPRKADLVLSRQKATVRHHAE